MGEEMNFAQMLMVGPVITAEQIPEKWKHRSTAQARHLMSLQRVVEQQIAELCKWMGDRTLSTNEIAAHLGASNSTTVKRLTRARDRGLLISERRLVRTQSRRHIVICFWSVPSARR